MAPPFRQCKVLMSTARTDDGVHSVPAAHGFDGVVYRDRFGFARRRTAVGARFLGRSYRWNVRPIWHDLRGETTLW